MNSDEASVVDLIRLGNPRATEQLYAAHRVAFVAWAVQYYQCEEYDAVEVYQKAFTILYFNIRNAKLLVLSSSVKTYLFSIAKNVFKERFRDNQKYQRILNIDEVQVGTELPNQIDTEILDAYNKDHEKEIVRRLLDRIGDPCRKLLNLIFIKGFATDAVVEEMGYSDERVVRKRKSLCLKQLREMMGQGPKNNGTDDTDL